MGTISQLMKGGARDTDIAADVFKEFSLRVIDGSDATTEAFESLNLNAEETAAAFGQGGEAANDMADTVIDKLNAIEDPLERNRIGTALFGTQWEDLGGAINNLDLSDAKNEMAAAGDTLDAMAQAGDGAGASMQAAKNSIVVAADEMKMKLAAAFAPSAVDFSAWVGDHQDEILLFLAQAAKAAVDVTVALIDAAGGALQFGSMMYKAGLDLVDGFLGPMTATMEAVGQMLQHVPGMGKVGDAMVSTAEKTRGVIDGMKAGADGMGKAGGAMFTLADKIRNGTATLDDFILAQQQSIAETDAQTTQTNALIDTLNKLPRGKPIDITAPGGEGVKDLLTQLGIKATTDNNKNIVVESPLAPEVLETLKKLGIEVVTNNGKTILVTSNAPAVKTDIDNLNTALNQLPQSRAIDVITNFATTGTPPPRTGTNNKAVDGVLGAFGKADGGPIGGNGGPRADDQLIWASTGEFMQQAAAVDHYGMSVMDAMNRRAIPKEIFMGYADGGPIGYGLPPGSSGSDGFPEWVTQMGAEHGVTPSTYAGHQESDRGEAGYAPNPEGLNRGIDWGGSVDSMQAFAEYLMSIAPTTPALEQIIWMNPNTGQKIGWAGGKPDSDGSYFASDYGGHTDHVHTRQSGPLTGAAAEAMMPAEIEIPVLSNDSSKEDVARAIIAQGRKRGYSDEEIKAILATGMQESGLDPNTAGGGGEWQGIFQQDTSYAGRNDPNQNIDEFYNRLDERHKGAAAGDIWDDIFWLQQRPGDTSGASAVANGRGAYKDEIMSQQDSAGALFDQVAPSVGTLTPADPGVAAPAGVQQVYVVGGHLDGAAPSTTPAATTPTVTAPAAPAAPEVYGRGPLPIVAYANGGTIPGIGNEDSELIWGMPGEEIISKGPAEEWRPFLKAINSGKLKRFAAGGTVGFGGYSPDTKDAMKPNNWYDWAALTVGGGFAVASLISPYVDMAASGTVSLGDALPTVDTSANSVDLGLAKVVDELRQQTEELKEAITKNSKTLHVVDNGNAGAASMLMMKAGY